MQNYTWNVLGSISKQCKYMSWPIAMQKLMLVWLILKDELHAVGWDEEWDRLGVRCTLQRLDLHTRYIITRGGPLRQAYITIVKREIFTSA